MNVIERLLAKFSSKRFGADFEQRVMEALEKQNSSCEDTVDEIVAHYTEIIRLICTDYTSVKLNADDLLTVTIDGTEYDLDDKSTRKSRKASEHRMAIEFLTADLSNERYQIFSRVEERLNRKLHMMGELL